MAIVRGRGKRSICGLLAALAMAIGAAGCGGDGASGVDPMGQSVVIIHVDFDATVPTVYQIEVLVHLGTAARENTLFFPKTPAGALTSGNTLALLFSPTILDTVDLTLYGRDGQSNRVAKGNRQVTISTGGAQIETTIGLTACDPSGC
jgi:hypothetical protein